MPLSDKILSFLKKLELRAELPKDVGVMNPFKDEATFSLCKKFYKKYYSDDHPRHLILGINPGRFGGGVTGVPFTDPIRLQVNCGIDNDFSKRQELSSVFIYEMINAYGGPGIFYDRFYISAISPLGFTKNNRNMNYYDDRQLESSIRNFVIDSINRQLEFPVKRDVVFCLGEGKNFTYLSKLNDEQKFFYKIVPLAHPRFIMQYKLKKKEEYIQRYLREMGK
ncbi:MAG: uracil-DNA glycosylase family protein [Ginsengibacter sp.]